MGKYYGVTFQSTPSLRKVTALMAPIVTSQAISIHTFLAEGDSCSQHGLGNVGEISIHTFLAEGDNQN